MLKIFFHAHSHWRYIIFLIAALALIALLSGWLLKRKWTKADKWLTLLFPISLDIQFLMGIPLWINRFQGAKDPLRLWEHPTTMIIALALAHVGFKKTKKEVEDHNKFKKASIFYIIATALVILGIWRITAGAILG